jgi:hypothetical protein
LTPQAATLNAHVRSIVEAIVDGLPPRHEVVAVRRQASEFATSARLWELEVTLTDGTHLDLVHKEGGRPARLPGAPRNVPAFVYDPRREIHVYEQLLDGRQLGTPRLYASYVQPHAGRYWMFLEHVPGIQLRWASESAAWHRVAGWLAQAHATLQPSGRADTSRLLVHDRPYYRRWLRRAQIFTDPTNRNRRKTLAWLAGHHEKVVETLAGIPRTIVHGEFYPSNILVDESSSDGRVSVIDWEMAALGPAVTDLAALTGGQLNSLDREALVRTYLRKRPPDGADSTKSFGPEAMSFARLQFAIQWLGWSRDWSPPDEQRHDWLTEAVELGETMGW